jgi:hypothetical protein
MCMLKRYFDDLTSDLLQESERIRRFFATHALSAGINREDMVAKLLQSHVLPAVGVETGLVLSGSGEFSNQADVILTDAQSNRALYGTRPIPIWLKEAVYGVIEVKTQLTPTTLADSVAKGARLKTLPSNFADSFERQKIADTLYCIWAFDAPQDLSLIKANIAHAVKNVPQSEQPDFIIVPNRFLWRGGSYFDLSVNGQKGSARYQWRLQALGGNQAKMLTPSCEMMNLGANTLVVFLYWLNSWLFLVPDQGGRTSFVIIISRAGDRLFEPDRSKNSSLD